MVAKILQQVVEEAILHLRKALLHHCKQRGYTLKNNLIRVGSWYRFSNFAPSFLQMHKSKIDEGL